MTPILALLSPLQNNLSKTAILQLSRIIAAMLAMTGRVTMLGLSRWTEKGGSYRTIQRFFYTVIPWAQVFWSFFQAHLLDGQDTYLLAGDESIVTKTGAKTHGLDRFFSGWLKQTVPGLSFFTLALISVQQRRAYPISVEQMIRTAEEKTASWTKRQAQKAKPADLHRKAGRPKGSRNQNKADVKLNPELLRIQKMLQSVLTTIRGTLRLTYLVLDGHFGNHAALHMARQSQLHLISKLRHDSALFFPYAGPAPKRGPIPRLGEKIFVRKIPDNYLKESKVEDGCQMLTYQLPLLHREFGEPLNVVILLRINLATQAWARVILFSDDLELAYEKMIDFYSLRFQIEFNFRDAKQLWGLEDFMNISQTAVTNAANLSLFMVDVSQLLIAQKRRDDPNFSLLDLKAHYRGYRYLIETLQMLPHKPDDILVSQLFQKVAALGRIHPAISPIPSG